MTLTENPINKLLISTLKQKAHNMQRTASRRGLQAPPVKSLIRMLWTAMLTPYCGCGKEMIVSSKLGSMKDTMTLHHDPDGSLYFICQSCNSSIKQRTVHSFFKDGVKQCNCCGQEKPNNRFYKNKHKPDGISTYCKTCTYNTKPTNT